MVEKWQNPYRPYTFETSRELRRKQRRVRRELFLARMELIPVTAWVYLGNHPLLRMPLVGGMTYLVAYTLMR